MLNKTLKEQPDVTELVLKKTRVVVLILACFIILGFMYVQNISSRLRLYAPNSELYIEVADNNESRSLGLSGRNSISDKEGMLFVFDEFKTSNCFWMKDMNFAIDMVWMDEHKKVINVVQNVGPETYPETFCPEANAKYGLEIRAGSAGEFGIEKGITLNF